MLTAGAIPATAKAMSVDEEPRAFAIIGLRGFVRNVKRSIK
jgi:hypothetical protein